MTTFIKAEEQNHSLRNYINVIESEIDTIDEQNRNIENEIRRHEELGSANEKQKVEMLLNLGKETEDMIAETETRKSQIGEIEQQMACCKDLHMAMIEIFHESHFHLGVATEMKYDEDTEFNENNIL